jgi:hypothetical protein
MKVILALKADPNRTFSINEKTYNGVYKRYTEQPDGDAPPETAKYVLKKNTPPQVKIIKTT